MPRPVAYTDGHAAALVLERTVFEVPTVVAIYYIRRPMACERIFDREIDGSEIDPVHDVGGDGKRTAFRLRMALRLPSALAEIV